MPRMVSLCALALVVTAATRVSAQDVREVEPAAVRVIAGATFETVLLRGTRLDAFHGGTRHPERCARA